MSKKKLTAFDGIQLVGIHKEPTFGPRENKDLREELETCEECGKTTEIEGEHHQCWCTACVKLFADKNERLREALEEIHLTAARQCDCQPSGGLYACELHRTIAEQALKE